MGPICRHLPGGPSHTQRARGTRRCATGLRCSRLRETQRARTRAAGAAADLQQVDAGHCRAGGGDLCDADNAPVRGSVLLGASVTLVGMKRVSERRRPSRWKFPVGKARLRHAAPAHGQLSGKGHSCAAMRVCRCLRLSGHIVGQLLVCASQGKRGERASRPMSSSSAGSAGNTPSAQVCDGPRGEGGGGQGRFALVVADRLSRLSWTHSTPRWTESPCRGTDPRAARAPKG